MPTRNENNLPDLSFLPDKQDITNLSIPERNDQIFYLYFIKSARQIDLSKHYGISQPIISRIISEYKNNPTFKDRAISVWEKDISIEARRKASQLVVSINPDNMPDGSKAMSAGILIDKARLIDDESTQNIAYADMSRELKDIVADEGELVRHMCRIATEAT